MGNPFPPGVEPDFDNPNLYLLYRYRNYPISPISKY